MLTFEDLVGDVAAFTRDYRDRQPLLRKKAIADPQRLLSFGDLDELLMSEAIRPPYVRVTKEGAQQREGDYTRLVRVQLNHMDDVADPSKLIEAFQTGATLTWNSMNHYRPVLRELTTVLSTALGCRTDVVAFATPPGVRGFAPHLDSTEVFVIQTSGTKKWTVWPTWRPRPAAGQALDTENLGDPLFTVDLEPGDCLYLPWGTPHVAYSGSQVALHLSVTAKPQTWADLVLAAVKQAIDTDEEYTSFPMLSPATATATAAELGRLVEAATRKTADLDMEQVAGTLIDQALPTFGIGTSDFFRKLEEVGGDLPGEVRIERADSQVSAEVGDVLDEDKVAVEIGLRTYSMPAGCVPALEALNSREAVSVAELGDLLGADDLAQPFVRTLVQVGFLRVVEADAATV